jgi:hypothetical protein
MVREDLEPAVRPRSARRVGYLTQVVRAAPQDRSGFWVNDATRSGHVVGVRVLDRLEGSRLNEVADVVVRTDDDQLSHFVAAIANVVK